MADTLSVTELLERYQEAARQSAAADENEASHWAYQAHTFYKTLRETEEGRNGVSALMGDADLQVRRWAATHSLMWDRERARDVLRSLDEGA
jgi:hypothetical protein